MHDFSTNSCLVENFVAEEGHRQILVRKKKKNFLWSQIESKSSTLNFLKTRSTDTLQVSAPQPQFNYLNLIFLLDNLSVPI